MQALRAWIRLLRKAGGPGGKPRGGRYVSRTWDARRKRWTYVYPEDLQRRARGGGAPPKKERPAERAASVDLPEHARDVVASFRSFIEAREALAQERGRSQVFDGDLFGHRRRAHDQAERRYQAARFGILGYLESERRRLRNLPPEDFEERIALLTKLPGLRGKERELRIILASKDEAELLAYLEANESLPDETLAAISYLWMQGSKWRRSDEGRAATKLKQKADEALQQRNAKRFKALFTPPQRPQRYPWESDLHIDPDTLLPALLPEVSEPTIITFGEVDEDLGFPLDGSLVDTTRGTAALAPWCVHVLDKRVGADAADARRRYDAEDAKEVQEIVDKIFETAPAPRSSSAKESKQRIHDSFVTGTPWYDTMDFLIDPRWTSYVLDHLHDAMAEPLMHSWSDRPVGIEVENGADDAQEAFRAVFERTHPNARPPRLHVRWSDEPRATFTVEERDGEDTPVCTLPRRFEPLARRFEVRPLYDPASSISQTLSQIERESLRAYIKTVAHMAGHAVSWWTKTDDLMRLERARSWATHYGGRLRPRWDGIYLTPGYEGRLLRPRSPREGHPEEVMPAMMTAAMVPRVLDPEVPSMQRHVIARMPNAYPIFRQVVWHGYNRRT